MIHNYLLQNIVTIYRVQSRDDKIRTYDILYPKQTRYQAAFGQ